MAGKWSHLEGQLKPEPRELSEWQQKVYALADEFKALPVAGIAARYNEARQAEEALEKELTRINGDIEALTLALDDKMKAESLEKIVADGYSFSISPEPIAQVTDKQALRAWAEEHARDNLQLHHSTLQALVKTALEGDGAMPEGVDIYLRRKINRRKA